MEDNKISTILFKIVDSTQHKKINWEKNPKSETSFKTSVGSTVIYISKSGSEYYFNIFNDIGDEIGRLGGLSYSYQLESLYDLAKRRALKIDEHLDELDSLLGKL